jgi:hypothetical protein
VGVGGREYGKRLAGLSTFSVWGPAPRGAGVELGQTEPVGGTDALRAQGSMPFPLPERSHRIRTRLRIGFLSLAASEGSRVWRHGQNSLGGTYPAARKLLRKRPARAVHPLADGLMWESH